MNIGTPTQDITTAGSPPRILPPGVQVENLTLRDYFAGQAIVGIVLSGNVTQIFEADAIYAYRIADAMLRVRLRNQTGPGL